MSLIDKRVWIPQALAVEAMLGLMAKGEEVNEESVHTWLEHALAGRRADWAELTSSQKTILARSMYFAERVIRGPKKVELTSFAEPDAV